MNVRHMRAVRLCAISVVLLGHTLALAAAEQTWAAYTSISGINTWFVVTGAARVIMSKGAFKIEMLDAGGDVVLAVNGTVRGNNLRGVVVRQHTDDLPRTVSGQYKTVKWRDGAGGREAILLTEVNEPGGLTLGLTRERR